MTYPPAQDVARRLIILKFQIVYSLSSPPIELTKKLVSNWSKEELRRFEDKFSLRSRQMRSSLENLNLWSYMTDEEKNFINATPMFMTEQQRVDALWLVESASMLMWAFKIIEDFPPFDEQVDVEVTKKIPNANIMPFINEASLRSHEEIEQKRSLAELWHWRSRTRKLVEMNQPLPPDLGFKSYDEIVRTFVKVAKEAGDLEYDVDGDFPVKGVAYRNLTTKDWSMVTSIAKERHKALNWLCGYAPDNNWSKTPTDT